MSFLVMLACHAIAGLSRHVIPGSFSRLLSGTLPIVGGIIAYGLVLGV